LAYGLYGLIGLIVISSVVERSLHALRLVEKSLHALRLVEMTYCEKICIIRIIRREKTKIIRRQKT
jgi:hypothetical protein